MCFNAEKSNIKIFFKYITIICLCILSSALNTTNAIGVDEQLSDALSFKKKGDWDNASRILISLIDSNPACAECYYHLGEIEDSKLNFEKAINYYRNATKYNPKYYYNLGIDLQTTGQWDKSIAAFQMFLIAFPKSLDGMIALGISLRKAGDLNNSKILFNEILTLLPENPTAHFNLSLIYIEECKKESALLHIKAYNKITKIKWNPYLKKRDSNGTEN